MKTIDAFAAMRNLIERVRVGMVTQGDAEGTLRCRPLQTLEIDTDGRLWLIVSASSKNAQKIAGTALGIAYADPDKQDYASISGKGRIVRDTQRISAHWNAWVELWLPQGINDPDLALLCVDIQLAEYWEAPGSTGQLIREVSRRGGDG